MPSNTNVAGSGTGLAPAPPAVSRIVTLPPAPMLSVFCTIEVAVRFVPAPVTLVAPAPEDQERHVQ